MARAIALSAIVLAAFASTASAGLIIDDFDGGSFLITTAGTASTDQAAVPGVISNGDRNSYVSLNTGTGTITGNMDNNGGLGVDSAYTLEAPITGAGKWVIDYGADTWLSANLSAGGNNALALEFIAGDSSATVTITVTSHAEGAAVSGQLAKGTTGVGKLYFPFASFTNAGTLDFTDIDKISVQIVGGTAGDYSIDFFEATPEPATLAFLALGAVGLAASRLRRKV